MIRKDTYLVLEGVTLLRTVMVSLALNTSLAAVAALSFYPHVEQT